MRAITFDIESISDSAVRGRVDVAEQEITVVGIHDSLTGEYAAYTRDELPQLWPIFEHADLLIGFNSDAFDVPLLNRYYPGDLASARSTSWLKSRVCWGDGFGSNRLHKPRLARASQGTA